MDEFKLVSVEMGHEEDLALRLLQMVGGHLSNPPLINSTRWPCPIFGSANTISFVNLLNFRGVFNDDAKGVYKVIERVVPRAMSTWTPLGWQSFVFQTTTPSHDSI